MYGKKFVKTPINNGFIKYQKQTQNSLSYVLYKADVYVEPS